MLNYLNIKKMKGKVYLLTILAASLMFFACGQQKNSFVIKQGVNINNAFSGLRGTGRNTFSRTDIEFIANSGFDHVRIPMDESTMFNANGQKIERAFALLHEILGWCDEFKLRAIVELHSLRSHSFLGTSDTERLLFTDPNAQEQLYEFWRKISGELKDKYSVDMVAYEPLNEPVAVEPEIWNVILNRYIEVIRELEPNRTILLPPNQWNTSANVKYLRIPENDPNLIISIHYYSPMLLTHYRASWVSDDDLSNLAVPVHYPGQLIADADLDSVSNSMARQGRRVYNIDVMENELMQAIEVGKKYNIPINCGEYGCITYAPEEDRIRWYKDVYTLFTKYGMSTTSWDYKSNNFGIVTTEGVPQTKIINAILGK